MMEKRYRKYGSMKHAKQLKVQVEDTTLMYLEHRSFIGHKTQVGYGKAVDDLCHDFQALLKEHGQLLHSYKQLLERYSGLAAATKNGELPAEGPDFSPNVARISEPC
jgi:hypothetical protein